MIKFRVLHDVRLTLVARGMMVSCKSIGIAYEFKVAPRIRLFVLDRN